MKLLYADGSNCAQRVAWALNYKGISFEVILYDSLSKVQLKLVSPLNKVPVLITAHGTFAESLAILEYLEEIQQIPALLPQSPFQRAKVREVLEIINGWIHPLQCSSAVKFFKPEISSEDIRSQRRNWIEKTLPILHEELLFKDSGFSIGNSFSLADLTLIPIYTKGLLLGLPVEQFPKFNNHVKHCLAIDAIRSSCPRDLLVDLKKFISY